MCINHDHESHDHQDKEMSEMLTKRRMIQALAAGGVVSVAAPTLSGCATNPETGSKQLLLIGEGQLTQMAAQSWAEAKRKQKLSTDPRYTKRLANIGSRIARSSKRDNQPWDYAVFDSDTKNAFVLPGNHVGFYKGMMDFADNDDQIAAVMGHEVGHVAGRHAQERVSQQMAGQVGLAVGGILGASQLSKKCRTIPDRRQQQLCYQRASRNSQLLNAALGMGFTLGVILPYSRRHESQSDLLGAKYMHNAGYDAYQSVKLWEKMAENSPRRQPEFMSTHPDPSRRARDLYNYIKYQEKLGSQGWQSIKMPKA
ncbi:MAG TPA: M48 family peptidase [Hellea balneolensis]|uniref:M48 family peptidase n=1 Tax=Hellea balneolensis TaxID=287478 RepID=A0A7C5LW27_9PROT|nr:M48 family peptidase [Hellea balneolensis]